MLYTPLHVPFARRLQTDLLQRRPRQHQGELVAEAELHTTGSARASVMADHVRTTTNVEEVHRRRLLVQEQGVRLR